MSEIVVVFYNHIKSPHCLCRCSCAKPWCCVLCAPTLHSQEQQPVGGNTRVSLSFLLLQVILTYSLPLPFVPLHLPSLQVCSPSHVCGVR